MVESVEGVVSALDRRALQGDADEADADAGMVSEALEGPVEDHVGLVLRSHAGRLGWAGGDGVKIKELGGAVDVIATL